MIDVKEAQIQDTDITGHQRTQAQCDILSAHRMEARSMLFTEYNEELHIRNEKKISYDDGYGNGYGNGKDVMSALYMTLEENGRLEDYSKAVRDPAYRDQLIKELIPDQNAD